MEVLRKENFIITTVDGEGKNRNIKVIFGILKRKNAIRFINNAFYTIENVTSVNKFENDPIIKKSFFNKNFVRR